MLFFGSNVTADYIFSSIAMDRGGFYENNAFSNEFGLMIHAATLILFTIILSIVNDRFPITDKPNRITFMALNAIWTLNNLWSVLLLW